MHFCSLLVSQITYQVMGQHVLVPHPFQHNLFLVCHSYEARVVLCVKGGVALYTVFPGLKRRGDLDSF